MPISTGVSGASFLKDPRVAKLVVDTLRHFDGARYHLHAWCVMPDHVHVIFSVLPARTPALRLSSIIQSWKSFTAKEATVFSPEPARSGSCEYYDHLVRDDEDFVRCIDQQSSEGLGCAKDGKIGQRADGSRIDRGPWPPRRLTARR
jgi:REP element-mobilizing transposase RayT